MAAAEEGLELDEAAEGFGRCEAAGGDRGAT